MVVNERGVAADQRFGCGNASRNERTGSANLPRCQATTTSAFAAASRTGRNSTPGVDVLTAYSGNKATAYSATIVDNI